MSKKDDNLAEQIDEGWDQPANDGSAAQKLPLKSQPVPSDRTRPYDEPFFKRKPELEKTSTLKGIGSGPGDLNLKKIEKIEGETGIEVTKTILMADMLAGDADFSVSDPRRIRQLSPSRTGELNRLLIGFSTPDYQVNGIANEGAIYTDKNRTVNLLTLAATNPSEGAYLVNEAALRTGAVSMRQNLDPVKLVDELGTIGNKGKNKLVAGAARIDLKKKTLETAFDGSNNRAYLIRNNSIVDCSRIEKENTKIAFGAFETANQKIKLAEKDLVVVISDELVKVLHELSGQVLEGEALAGVDDIVAREILAIVTSSRNSSAEIDFDSFAEKLLAKVDRYLQLNHLSNLETCNLMVVEIPR